MSESLSISFVCEECDNSDGFAIHYMRDSDFDAAEIICNVCGAKQVI